MSKPEGITVATAIKLVNRAISDVEGGSHLTTGVAAWTAESLLIFVKWKLDCYSPDIKLVPSGVTHAENIELYKVIKALQGYYGKA